MESQGLEDLNEFLKIPGIVINELYLGQYIDFVTIRVRKEGNRRIAFATLPIHRDLKAQAGESFLLMCTCLMVEKFVVLHRARDAVQLIYKKFSFSGRCPNTRQKCKKAYYQNCVLPGGMDY